MIIIDLNGHLLRRVNIPITVYIKSIYPAIIIILYTIAELNSSDVLKFKRKITAAEP